MTELMTNMVDAMLVKHAFLKGIDPKGKKAPATMHEAVDKLMGTSKNIPLWCDDRRSSSQRGRSFNPWPFIEAA